MSETEEKRREGAPCHVPTDANRATAEQLGGQGMPHHDIASLLHMATKTLLKYYGAELAIGKAKANANVSGMLYKLAMSGNLGACIFWMKSQAGWTEKTQHEHFGKEGAPPIALEQRGYVVSPDVARDMTIWMASAASETAPPPQDRETETLEE